MKKKKKKKKQIPDVKAFSPPTCVACWHILPFFWVRDILVEWQTCVPCIVCLVHMSCLSGSFLGEKQRTKLLKRKTTKHSLLMSLCTTLLSYLHCPTNRIFQKKHNLYLKMSSGTANGVICPHCKSFQYYYCQNCPGNKVCQSSI